MRRRGILFVTRCPVFAALEFQTFPRRHRRACSNSSSSGCIHVSSSSFGDYATFLHPCISGGNGYTVFRCYNFITPRDRRALSHEPFRAIAYFAVCVCVCIKRREWCNRDFGNTIITTFRPVTAIARLPAPASKVFRTQKLACGRYAIPPFRSLPLLLRALFHRPPAPVTYVRFLQFTLAFASSCESTDMR